VTLIETYFLLKTTSKKMTQKSSSQAKQTCVVKECSVVSHQFLHHDELIKSLFFVCNLVYLLIEMNIFQIFYFKLNFQNRQL